MIQTIVEWFGSQKRMAEALGVDKAAVCQWVAAGKLPPARAIQIERLTGGEFKAVDIMEDGE